jgi:protein ImuA
MSSFDDLLRHPGLWRAREQTGSTAESSVLPTGYAALDRCLPGGGWPRQGLIEILVDRCGIGELSLLMPALATLGRDEHEDGWFAWISPPYQPYAPALVARGIDLHRLLIVRAQPAEWAMEQALRSGVCSVVIGWAAFRDRQGLRRLQLASEQSRCMTVLFRGLADGEQPSPAVLRIALTAGPGGLEARILKSRGGRPVTIRLGWLDTAAQAAAH